MVGCLKNKPFFYYRIDPVQSGKRESLERKGNIPAYIPVLNEVKKMAWQTKFTDEDMKKGYPETLSEIRKLNYEKFNYERFELLKSQWGIFKNNAERALNLFDKVLIEKPELKYISIFDEV
jgi:hypothetical protein